MNGDETHLTEYDDVDIKKTLLKYSGSLMISLAHISLVLRTPWEVMNKLFLSYMLEAFVKGRSCRIMHKLSTKQLWLIPIEKRRKSFLSKSGLFRD